MAYSAVPTSTTGDLWTAANQNTYLRDNMAALYASTSSDPRFIQCTSAYNNTDSTEIDREAFVYGYKLPDAKASYGMGATYIPAEPAGSITIQTVIVPQTTNNCVCRQFVQLGASGEDYNTHDDSEGSNQTRAVTANQWNFLPAVTASSLAAGDIILTRFYRDGTDVADTIGGHVDVLGWVINYT